MEFKDETEPLLNKEDNIIEIQDVFQKDHIGINKSKIQILNKSCSCSNIFENLFFCCIDYDLTNRQYELYLNLRNRLSIPYNQEDSNHEKLLKDFFSNLNDIIPEEVENTYENINDSNTISTNINNESSDNILLKKIAKTIGFQNNNPRTDFRAGGLSSLEFMNYFVDHHNLELKNILKEKYFNFALACINLTFLFRLVLYLTNIVNTETTLKSYGLQGCTRYQIKIFSEQLEKNSHNNVNFIFSLMSQCLIFIFKKYQNEFEYDKKDENFIKINSIIRLVIFCLKETLDNLNKNENLEDKLKIRLTKELNSEYKKIKTN